MHDQDELAINTIKELKPLIDVKFERVEEPDPVALDPKMKGKIPPNQKG